MRREDWIGIEVAGAGVSADSAGRTSINFTRGRNRGGYRAGIPFKVAVSGRGKEERFVSPDSYLASSHREIRESGEIEADILPHGQSSPSKDRVDCLLLPFRAAKENPSGPLSVCLGSL